MTIRRQPNAIISLCWIQTIKTIPSFSGENRTFTLYILHTNYIWYLRQPVLWGLVVFYKYIAKVSHRLGVSPSWCKRDIILVGPAAVASVAGCAAVMYFQFTPWDFPHQNLLMHFLGLVCCITPKGLHCVGYTTH